MTKQDSANWVVQSGGSSFTSNGYQVSDSQASSYFPCDETGVAMSNFTFQVEMAVTAGDGGGVIFRHTASSEYRLRVSANGTYDLGGPGMSLISGSSTAIHTGVNQSNLVTIIAQGSNIYIYINKQRILYTTDPSVTTGVFGLFAIDFTQPTTALFKNVKIWQN